MDDSLKARIDGMDRMEMARLWRFGPIGHEMLQGQAGDYFKARFDELGGMTPTVSKAVGWAPTETVLGNSMRKLTVFHRAGSSFFHGEAMTYVVEANGALVILNGTIAGDSPGSAVFAAGHWTSVHATAASAKGESRLGPTGWAIQGPRLLAALKELTTRLRDYDVHDSPQLQAWNNAVSEANLAIWAAEGLE